MRAGDVASFAGRGLAGALAAAAIAAITPAGAGAATLTVTTTDETSASTCTLNDAITSANSNFNWGACTATDLPYGADTINITATGTMNRTAIVPPVFSPMDINGPGSDLLDIHRQSGGDYRLFANNPGTTTSLSGVTLSNGRLVDEFSLGAGLSNSGTLTLDDVVVRDSQFVTSSASEDTFAAGGGIYNTGTLTLRHSTVADNSATVSQTATSGASDATAFGGGIYSEGPLTIERSTISGNTASASVASADASASAVAEGGGIANLTYSLALTASTVSGNESVATAPAPATTSERGGGIHNTGTLVATGDTIVDNTGVQSANLAPDGDESLTSTILFSEGEPNCDGSVETDGGFNLEFPASCTGLAAAVHADPLLGTLADNGGPTWTHAFDGLSPALDQGKGAGATTDQRDLVRPVDLAIANAVGGDGADIGAFEAQDEDADGVNDAADACPAADGGGNASGCPSAARTLTLKYSARRKRFTGTLVAPGFADCHQSRAVSVWMKRAGVDKQVGQPTTDTNGKYSLDTRGKPRKRYYAQVDEEVIAPVAQCEAATSPTIKVPN